jgi:hypothetical protein
MTTRREGLAVAIGLVSYCIAAPTLAEPTKASRDPVAAEALFQRAKEQLKANDWTGACAKFQASMDLDANASTALKLAKCHEHDGKIALAWLTVQRAITLNRDRADQSDQRRREIDAYARTELTALEPRVPRLRVTVRDKPPGLVVRRGGSELPLAALGEALPEDAGSVEIAAEAPGWRAERKTVRLVEGQTVDVELSLSREALPPAVVQPPVVAAPVAAVPVDVPSAAAPPVSRPVAGPPVTLAAGTGRAQRTAGLVLGGLGFAGLGVAGGLGGAILAKVGEFHDACPNNTCTSQAQAQPLDAARTFQKGALIAAGAGVGLLAVGLVVYFSAPSRADAPSAAVVVHGSGAALDLCW